MGQLLALGKFAPLNETFAGFFSIFLISASILVLNDYFDVKIDKINAPHRPIPSNLVTPFEALIFSITLLIMGLILSYLISFAAFLCSIALSIVGFLYNLKFKKSGLPGNLMVSFSVGMTFIYGGLSVGLPFNKMVVIFAAIAAFIDLGEEIAADAMDMRGDLLINSNSLAIKYGKQTALKISVSIFFFVLLLSSVPFILNWFSFVYLLPIAIIDFAVAYSSFKLIKSENEEGRKFIRLLYLGATAGLLIFLVMRFSGM